MVDSSIDGAILFPITDANPTNEEGARPDIVPGCFMSEGPRRLLQTG